MYTKALEQISRARTSLILDYPFFGSLTLKLKLVPEPQCETAAVSPDTLYFNPEWLGTLNKKQTIGLLAHEVMHLAMGHCWREGDRKHTTWNVATDYTINYELLNTGFSLPPGGLGMDNSKYVGLGAEEIYTKLLQNPDNKKDEKSDEKSDEFSDPGGCGGVLKAKGSKKEQKEQEVSWKIATNQALQKNKAGLSPRVRKLLEDRITTKLAWYVLLRDFVEMTAKNDYSWTRVNRRYISNGIILPSLINEELPEVCIAVDTSGSIDINKLDYFCKECSNVLMSYNTTIRIIYCDSRIQGEELYSTQDLPLKMKPVGGGGTDFRPVFDYINKKQYTPSCLIYFTDMQGYFPNTAPSYPTLWLDYSKGSKKPAFGTVVKLGTE